MQKNFAVFFAAIVAIASAIYIFSPAESLNSSGLVVLSQDTGKFDSYFQDGKLKQEIIEMTNLHARNVPEHVLQLFGNNKINAYVELGNGTVRSYWIRTEKGKLKEILAGSRESADLEVKLSESTLDRIVYANDPAKELAGALNSGDIQHNGLSSQGKIQSIIVRVASSVIGVVNGIGALFSGLFG